MGMITCPECGKQVHEKKKICPHCGVLLPEGEAEEMRIGKKTLCEIVFLIVLLFVWSYFWEVIR